MKYSEYTSKPKFKGSAAFYTVIACCLLALGGASWFAASKISRRSSDGNNSPSQIPDSPQSSAVESISEPQATVSENVGKSVSDEPYSSKPDAAEPKTESKLPKKVFTIPVQGDIIKKYSDKELQFSATYGDMRILAVFSSEPCALVHKARLCALSHFAYGERSAVPQKLGISVFGVTYRKFAEQRSALTERCALQKRHCHSAVHIAFARNHKSHFVKQTVKRTGG